MVLLEYLMYQTVRKVLVVLIYLPMNIHFLKHFKKLRYVLGITLMF